MFPNTRCVIQPLPLTHLMHLIRKAMLVPLFVVCAIFLNSCYLWKQGAQLFFYTTASAPIKKLENDPKTPDSLKRFFSLVKEIRTYAADSIGLSKNNNFTNYVPIDKRYLIDLVAATGKADFVPYKWCYPIFGCWPLRGYFDSTDAKKEAFKLQQLGYDVYRGHAGAFSTLGILSDPVYSFMKNYSLYHIANLIIHEQTHTVVYVKNQADFSEEFASFVGAQGALAFIRSTYGETSDQYTKSVKTSHDIDAYYRCVRTLYKTLSGYYDGNLSFDEKLRKKQEAISRFKDSVAVNYPSIFQTQDYHWIEKADINNAFIGLDMTYTLDLDLFYRLYHKQNDDLQASITVIKNIAKKKGNCRDNLKELVAENNLK
jgi:predicted aminopeptidase